MTKEEAKKSLTVIESAYPEIAIPYVGPTYDRSGHNGLMLVGESHYLCESTKCDCSQKAWYSGKSVDSLSPCDKEWINTRKILETRILDGFKNHPRNIWKKVAEEIAKVIPISDSQSVFEQVYSKVVAFNFFVRPAIGQKSIEIEKTDMVNDVDVAKLRFHNLVREYNPRAVIVLSSFVALYVSGEELRNDGVAYLSTPHPASHWWNRLSMKYGTDGTPRRGRELIAPFIQSLNLHWA